MYQRTDLTGREVIFTNIRHITQENLVDVINKALPVHEKNSTDIEYLYNYYKGKQPILFREKQFQQDINNRIVVNRANEIVNFKVGYLIGEPVQYVNQGADEYSGVVNRLNDFMRYEDKDAKDKSVITWNTICGTAYRMVLADEVVVKGMKQDASPFEVYTLDPRSTFVVYHSGLDKKRVLGVSVLLDEDNQRFYDGYTETHHFVIKNDKVTKWEPHYLREVPIIEYPANEARLGAFEIVLPLLDAINTIESNRVDSVEQAIQAILVLKGTDLSDEDFEMAKRLGGLKIPKEGDAFYVKAVLDQNETQSLINDAYEEILTICGMPNRNGGSSTSDTGSAVIYRDGWWAAETRAKNSEGFYKSSEREFLNIALRIMDRSVSNDIRTSQIEIRFTRRNYENITEKSNVLVAMLNNNKIHPKLAFEHCGMFVDPEIAYKISEKYEEETIAKQERELQAFNEQEIMSEKKDINRVTNNEIDGR